MPVKAFEKWEKQHVRVANKPLFSENEGKPLTGRELNKVLKGLLGDLVDYRKGSITAHSFRSGLASLMAEKGMSMKISRLLEDGVQERLNGT
jgi:hypothetical protein